MKIVTTMILGCLAMGAFASDCCKGGSCHSNKDPFLAQAMMMAGRAAKLDGDKLACACCSAHGKTMKHGKAAKASKKHAKKHSHGH